MAKKRTKSDKKKVQSKRESGSIRLIVAPEQQVISTTTSISDQIEVAPIVTSAPIDIPPSTQPEGILTKEQKRLLTGDIVRSLTISGVVGILLFGIFLYIINAVQ